MKLVTLIIVNFFKIWRLVSVELTFIILLRYLLQFILIWQISFKSFCLINFHLQRLYYRMISQRVLKVFVERTKLIIWILADSWKVKSATVIFWIVFVAWCLNVFAFVYLWSCFQIIYLWILIAFHLHVHIMQFFEIRIYE